MKCKSCGFVCSKSGKQKTGIQKYRCKSCGIYQQANYVYKACRKDVQEQFSRMNRLGCGVQKMSSFLGISINTTQKWIGKASCLQPNNYFELDGTYDIDELQTCVGKRNNKVWVTYAWDVSKKIAVAVHVGGRSSEDLINVTSKVLTLLPQKVSTDNYSAYPNLLKGTVHSKGKRRANHIERQHLNLRKDIACLIRETMCYAKKVEMLEARLKWYFWGENDLYFFLRA